MILNRSIFALSLAPRLLAPAIVATLLGSLGSHVHAAATVAASWDYQTKTSTNNFDQGGFNTGALYDGNFTQLSGSFEKIANGSAISVSAREGEIHLLNEFSITAGGFGRFNLSQLVNATVGGGFEESLTINDATRNGQRGVYTGSIKVNLAYFGSGNVANRNVFGVGVGSNLANAAAASENVFYDNGGISTYAYLGFGPSNPQSFTDRVVNFSVPFIFGEAFGMAVWMESFIGTEGRTQLATTISHDASHTVEWAGTVLVEDSTGNDLAPTDYTLTSASGQNYVAAIPEPSTVMLGTLSLLFGTYFHRRRRK